MAGTFPDSEGSDAFTQAFRNAVAPPKWRRSLRGDGLPVVALDVDSDDPVEIRERIDKVLEGLEGMLTGFGGAACTPYARSARTAPVLPGQEYLTLEVAEGLRRTRPSKRALKLRNLRFMRDITAEFRANPAHRPSERELRDRVYSLRAEEANGGALHWLAGVRGDFFDSGVFAPLGVLIKLFGVPLLYTFPRWCWATWWSQRLLKPRRLGVLPNRRNWYGQWRRIGRTGHSLFHFVAELLQRESTRMLPAGGESTADFGAAADEARLDLEEMLLHALLADLHAARPGWGPWARRRRTRRVVLLDLPPVPDVPGEGAESDDWNAYLSSYPVMAARFLRACVKASPQLAGAGVVVVAAGRRAEDDPSMLGRWDRRGSLREGADRFRPTALPTLGQPLSVRLEPMRWNSPELHVVPIESPKARPNIRPGTEAAVLISCVTLVLSVTVGQGVARIDGGEPECFQGQSVSTPRNASTSNGPAGDDEKSPAEQYAAVRASIDSLNSQALKAERRNRPVRRVVYFGATVPKDREEAIDNGAIPELRGLWLSQQRLNAAAVDDQDRVRIYLDVRDTGTNFTHAPAVASWAVRQAERYKEAKDHRTIVGVVGFSESRRSTRRAAEILNDGQVPVIATTATADAMQKGLTYYRPMSPSNSRESAVAAQFAHNARIIRTEGRHCAEADHAVVIKDPGDLFSDELGTMFAKRFGSGAETLSLSEQGGATTPDDIARTVCARIKQNPRTVVYWAARVRNFSAFLGRYGPDSGCAGLPLTVVGSNDLTSTALRGKYRPYMQKWLNLYHTVHVLPETHPDNSDESATVFSLYVQAFTARDPWLNDGHVALAHDALKTLSLATDRAYSSTSGQDRPGTANTELVKSKLDEKVTFQGASGVISFPERYGPKPPLNKALVLLHPTADGLTVALRCGAFELNAPARTHWIPGSSQSCPTDDEQ